MATAYPDPRAPRTFDIHPLYALTRAVAAAGRPEETFEAALRGLRDSIGVERSSLLLFDRDGVMRFRAWQGLSADYRAAVDGHSPWSPETADPEPVLVPDAREEPSLSGLLPIIEAEGIRALAFIPLTLGGRLLGKFMLYYDEPHDFDEQEILIAQIIAAHVAFAVDQQEHRESEHRYRELVDSLGLALYTTDAAGRITYYNHEAESLWGRRPTIGQELYCGSWRLYTVDGAPLPHDACPMAVALRENRPVRGVEIVAERPDGKRRTLLPHPTPVHDAAGNVAGAINILVDITARREMEQQLRQANSIKDEFLGLVSHEIKTPITTVVGNAEILVRSSGLMTPEQRNAALMDILDEGRRLHGIIENLLVIARLDRGARIEKDIVLIDRLAASVLEAHRGRSPNRQFMLDVRANAICVEVNEGYFEQVLSNLITNAEKYSPPSAPIVVVVEQDETRALVRVLDRGPGVAEAERDLVFTPFYRSPVTAQRAGGVGIGLSVCRRLIEAQDGEIWFRPRDGGGSDVGFALPLYADS